MVQARGRWGFAQQPPFIAHVLKAEKYYSLGLTRPLIEVVFVLGCIHIFSVISDKSPPTSYEINICLELCLLLWLRICSLNVKKGVEVCRKERR